eukprot:SAG25_NODE_3_length_30426_cov_8.268210_4_plen_78_part_00
MVAVYQRMPAVLTPTAPQYSRRSGQVLDRLLGASDVYLFHYCNEQRDYGDALVVTQAEMHIVSEDGGETFALVSPNG